VSQNVCHKTRFVALNHLNTTADIKQRKHKKRVTENKNYKIARKKSYIILEASDKVRRRGE